MLGTRMVMAAAGSGNAGGPVTVTFRGAATNTNSTSVPIGTANGDRYVIVAVSDPGGSGPLSVNISGTAASGIVGTARSGNVAQIWWANIPSGTTATVSLGASVQHFAVYTSINPTIHQTDASWIDIPSESVSGDFSIGVPADGAFVYAAAHESTNGIGADLTTYLDDSLDGGVNDSYVGSGNFTSADTVSLAGAASGTGDEVDVVVAASFG